MRLGATGWNAVAAERGYDDEAVLIVQLKAQLKEAHATIERLEMQLRTEKENTDAKLESVMQMVRSFEQQQLEKLNEKDKEIQATRLEAQQGNKDLEQLVQEMRIQIDKRERDFQVLNAVLAKKQEDLVFAYEQIKETKEWATEQIQELKGSASEQVKKLEAKVESIDKAAESERRGLELQLDQRIADNKTLQKLLDAEKLRNTSLVSSTTDLSRRIERELETKLLRLEAEVSRVSALNDALGLTKNGEGEPPSRDDSGAGGSTISTHGRASVLQGARQPRQQAAQMPSERKHQTPLISSAKMPSQQKIRTPPAAFEQRRAIDDVESEYDASWDDESVLEEYFPAASSQDLQAEALRDGKG